MPCDSTCENVKKSFEEHGCKRNVFGMGKTDVIWKKGTSTSKFLCNLIVKTFGVGVKDSDCDYIQQQVHLFFLFHLRLDFLMRIRLNCYEILSQSSQLASFIGSLSVSVVLHF